MSNLLSSVYTPWKERLEFLKNLSTTNLGSTLDNNLLVKIQTIFFSLINDVLTHPSDTVVIELWEIIADNTNGVMANIAKMVKDPTSLKQPVDPSSGWQVLLEYIEVAYPLRLSIATALDAFKTQSPSNKTLWLIYTSLQYRNAMKLVMNTGTLDKQTLDAIVDSLLHTDVANIYEFNLTKIWLSSCGYWNFSPIIPIASTYSQQTVREFMRVHEAGKDSLFDTYDGVLGSKSISEYVTTLVNDSGRRAPKDDASMDLLSGILGNMTWSITNQNIKFTSFSYGVFFSNWIKMMKETPDKNSESGVIAYLDHLTVLSFFRYKKDDAPTIVQPDGNQVLLIPLFIWRKIDTLSGHTGTSQHYALLVIQYENQKYSATLFDTLTDGERYNTFKDAWTILSTVLNINSDDLIQGTTAPNSKEQYSEECGVNALYMMYYLMTSKDDKEFKHRYGIINRATNKSISDEAFGWLNGLIKDEDWLRKLKTLDWMHRHGKRADEFIIDPSYDTSFPIIRGPSAMVECLGDLVLLFETDIDFNNQDKEALNRSYNRLAMLREMNLFVKWTNFFIRLWYDYGFSGTTNPRDQPFIGDAKLVTGLIILQRAVTYKIVAPIDNLNEYFDRWFDGIASLTKRKADFRPMSKDIHDMGYPAFDLFFLGYNMIDSYRLSPLTVPDPSTRKIYDKIVDIYNRTLVSGMTTDTQPSSKPGTSPSPVVPTQPPAVTPAPLTPSPPSTPLPSPSSTTSKLAEAGVDDIDKQYVYLKNLLGFNTNGTTWLGWERLLAGRSDKQSLGKQLIEQIIPTLNQIELQDSLVIEAAGQLRTHMDIANALSANGLGATIRALIQRCFTLDPRIKEGYDHMIQLLAKYLIIKWIDPGTKKQVGFDQIYDAYFTNNQTERAAFFNDHPSMGPLFDPVTKSFGPTIQDTRDDAFDTFVDACEKAFLDVYTYLKTLDATIHLSGYDDEVAIIIDVFLFHHQLDMKNYPDLEAFVELRNILDALDKRKEPFDKVIKVIRRDKSTLPKGGSTAPTATTTLPVTPGGGTPAVSPGGGGTSTVTPTTTTTVTPASGGGTPTVTPTSGGGTTTTTVTPASGGGTPTVTPTSGGSGRGRGIPVVTPLPSPPRPVPDTLHLGPPSQRNIRLAWEQYPTQPPFPVPLRVSRLGRKRPVDPNDPLAYDGVLDYEYERDRGLNKNADDGLNEQLALTIYSREAEYARQQIQYQKDEERRMLKMQRQEQDRIAWEVLTPEQRAYYERFS